MADMNFSVDEKDKQMIAAIKETCYNGQDNTLTNCSGRGYQQGKCTKEIVSMQ